jgi:hypothetical protein
MAVPTSDRAELAAEKALLLKAEVDIEEGWLRLRNQQDIVRELQAGGHDTGQAERLVRLMQETLVEWERHRVLIEQRVAYLQTKV